MRHWRWAVVFGGVAALISIPVVSASWPVDQPSIGADELQQRIASSADDPYSGLFETRGGLRLPDLGRYEDEVAPFKTSSRVRVWYAAPDSWRADELLIGAERGTYREPGGLWRWDSGTRRIVFSPRGDVEPPRIPRLMDLSPAEAGRRLLAEASPGEVTQISAKRVAGHVAAGLRITPSSTTTTIHSIELWADVDTGVVLRLQIDTGGTAPVFESQFVDLHFGRPAADVVTFDPTETDQPVRRADTVDVIEALSQNQFIPLPDQLAGLPRRGQATGGLATYGSGFSTVTMVAVPRGSLGRPNRGIYAVAPTDRPWGGQAIVIPTSLFNMEIVSTTLLDVILAGTVTEAELDRIAGTLSEQALFL
jgi:hypothetical protein